MENLSWVWLMVIVPVFATFFKTEIGKILATWNIYKLRNFDLDGNPETLDQVQLLNRATGNWFTITIERYCFSLSTKKRGVYLLYKNGAKEKVTLLTWATWRKRSLPL